MRSRSGPGAAGAQVERVGVLRAVGDVGRSKIRSKVRGFTAAITGAVPHYHSAGRDAGGDAVKAQVRVQPSRVQFMTLFLY